MGSKLAVVAALAAGAVALVYGPGSAQAARAAARGYHGPDAVAALQRRTRGGVELERDTSQRVTVTLDKRAFSYWDERRNGWCVGRGCDTIGVGDSSRTLPLRATIPMRRGRCGR
jgi:beta-glucosidase